MQIPEDANLTSLVTHQVDPKTLTPADYNPRRISAKQKAALQNSLEEFGFLQPIIVNESTGVIVGGHQRLDAALHLGLTAVPVVYVDLNEQQEKTLNIALNKISGDWDYGQLVDLLDELEPTSDFDLTGFDIDEFQAIQRAIASDNKEGREGKVDPPARNPQSAEGEVYQLGDHILVIDDCTDPDAYQHTTTQCRMMFTDPPYNVAYEGGTEEKLKILNDSFESKEDYRTFLVAFLLASLAKNDGVTYMCYASSESEAVHGAWNAASMHQSSEIHTTTPSKPDKTKREKKADVILWDKETFTLGRSHYQQGHEPILYGWHQGAKNKHWCGDRTQSNVWIYQKPSRNKEHPTMKPVELVERAIRNSSEPDDWVLDPFLGSGTTLIAAENIGRRCYGLELDPRFADVIIRRYLSLPGAGEVTRLVSTEHSTPDGWWNEPAPEPTTQEATESDQENGLG